MSDYYFLVKTRKGKKIHLMSACDVSIINITFCLRDLYDEFEIVDPNVHELNCINCLGKTFKIEPYILSDKQAYNKLPFNFEEFQTIYINPQNIGERD